MLITQFTQSSSFENASFLLSDTLIRVLEAEPYITRFQSFALKAGLLKTKEEVQGIIFKGIDIDFDTSSFQFQWGKHYQKKINYTLFVRWLVCGKCGD